MKRWLVALALLAACGDGESALRGVDLATLRSHTDAPPRGLEHFDAPGESAADILDKGWSYQDQPPFALATPIDWHAREDDDRSWSFALHAWQPVAAVLAAYSSGGERRYLDAALDIALDWIAQNPRGERGMAWSDMAVGLRTYQLAYLIDVARRLPDVPDDQVKKLWSSLVDHLDYLGDDGNIAFHSNHGFYQCVGQLAAATRFAWIAGMPGIVSQAEGRIQRMMGTQFADDGVHNEHSPGYHRMVLEAWLTLISEHLFSASWADDLTLKIETALAWMIQPDGTLAMLDDTAHEDALPSLAELAIDAPALEYVVSGGARGAAPAENVRAFADGGLVVMRDWNGGDASYLAEQCAFHSRTHKHADDLAFVWSDRGHPILIGPGVYGYLGKPDPELAKQGFWYGDPKRVYVESTAAQNTIEVDGKSQDRTRTPFGSGVVYGGVQGGVRVAECRAPEAGGITHTRVLVTQPGAWLVVLDVLDGSAPHDYRQWWHFAEDLTVTSSGGGGGLAVTGAGAPLAVASLLGDASWSAPIRGQADPLQGWWSAKSGALAPATAVALVHTGTAHAVFATVFGFDGALAPGTSTVDASGAQLRWTQGGAARALAITGIDTSTPTVVYNP